jgi:transcription antitermination factor NusG
MFPWKVIYVQSRAEKKVCERLNQKGVEAYVPLKKETKQWSDRKKLVASPLISGYVFVKPNPKQRDLVLQDSSVLQYVRYNGSDAIIRENEMEALKSIEIKGYFVEGAFGASIQVGDAAIIQYGPFKGLRGIVKSSANENQFYVAIDSIDFCLTIRVPKEILIKN